MCYFSLLVATMKISFSYTPAAVGGILQYELDTESLLTPIFYQLGSLLPAVIVIIIATIFMRLVINILAELKQGMNNEGSNVSSTSGQHEIVSIQITQDGAPIIIHTSIFQLTVDGDDLKELESMELQEIPCRTKNTLRIGIGMLLVVAAVVIGMSTVLCMC